MQVTKQHKILGAVIALGLTAVGIDRFVLASSATAPASASAATAVDVGSAAAPPTGAQAPAGEAESEADNAGQSFTEHASLSDRLAALSAKHDLSVAQVVDAFEPRGDWGRPKTTEESRVEALRFADKHELEAVLSVNGEWVAVVGGETLRLGNVYDEHMVTRIDATTATFTRDGVSVTMSVSPIDDR